MKISSYLPLFLVLTFAYGTSNILPSDVQWLVSKRSKAVDKIDRTFIEELDKLKIKYMNSGELDHANAIEELIEEVESKIQDRAWIYRLVEVKPTKYSVGHGELLINTIPQKNCRVLLDGKNCDEFIHAHAKSSLVYKIPRRATHFTAIGLAQQARWIGHTWKYVVKIDGKTAFESRSLMSYDNKQVPIEIELPRLSDEIELIILPMGNNISDASIWARPRFEER